MLPDLLTPKEASRYLAVSPRTLRRLVQSGRLVPADVAPGSPRFDAAALAAYVARCRRGGQAEAVTIGRVVPNVRGMK